MAKTSKPTKKASRSKEDEPRPRNLKKKDMLINLLGKASKNSKTYTHTDGTKQYDRVNDKNRTLTHIVNKTNVVKSINKFHDTQRARKQAYKNFK